MMKVKSSWWSLSLLRQCLALYPLVPTRSTHSGASERRISQTSAMTVWWQLESPLTATGRPGVAPMTATRQVTCSWESSLRSTTSTVSEVHNHVPSRGPIPTRWRRREAIPIWISQKADTMATSTISNGGNARSHGLDTPRVPTVGSGITRHLVMGHKPALKPIRTELGQTESLVVRTLPLVAELPRSEER